MKSTNKKNLFLIIKNYTLYQLLTKTVSALILFPVFKFLTDMLIKSTGRMSISSGDYLPFIFSLQGLGLAVLSILLLVILVGVDINAFIIISAMVHEGLVEFNIIEQLIIGIKSLRSFLTVEGVLLFIFVALIVPLLSVGVTIPVMENFKIPNFITSVILANKIYKIFYYIILLLLTVVTIRYIFTFHYVLLLKYNLKEAMKSSVELVKKHFKNFFLQILLHFATITVIIILFIYLFLNLSLKPTYLLVKSLFYSRFFSLFFLMHAVELLTYTSFMAIPIVVTRLTKFFYAYNEQDGTNINYTKYKRIKNMKKLKKRFKNSSTKMSLLFLSSFILIFNIIFCFYLTENFEQIFPGKEKIEVVAHRAGGNLDVENSLEGLKSAYNFKADRAEIDVQRTRDGKYIINHDKNFKRLAGNSKKSYQMDLYEINTLRLKNTFDPESEKRPVATLDQMMDYAKGKIKLFIELKGETADFKMVDDVVKMINERGMIDQCAILSLDSKIIEYTKEHYPEIDTGYLYFFAIGNLWDLKGDFLIMEESEASDENIARIQSYGKKAYVWTVNTEESIKRFTNSYVDGIITDDVVKVESRLKDNKNRSDIDLILDTLFR